MISFVNIHYYQIESREEMKNYIDMKRYGLTEEFEREVDKYKNLSAARILSQEKGLYRIVASQGEKLAEISGKFQFKIAKISDYPAVGDFVMVNWNPSGNSAIPVVVLTKSDLCNDLSSKLSEVYSIALGIDILTTTTQEQNDYTKLFQYVLDGKTVAFIGSSGVGKSTLINCLLGGEYMKTNGLRNDDKGRHTTTRRESFTGNAISAQPGKVAYSIFDSKLLKKYKKHGSDIVSHVHPHDLFDHFDEQWSRDIANGYEPVSQADTLEELAEKAGIDVAGFMEQIEEYNDMCEAGFDEVFEKDRSYMQPIEKGPFYCCCQSVGAYGSLGGVKINHKTQVLTQDAKVIPGLYCVGTDACNIFGDSYPFILSGNTMGFCLNSGRIAGENAAAELDNFEF